MPRSKKEGNFKTIEIYETHDPVVIQIQQDADTNQTKLIIKTRRGLVIDLLVEDFGMVSDIRYRTWSAEREAV